MAQALNMKNITTYISAGLNILVSGKHGTGKTEMITQGAKSLGYNVLHYSASTLDPFVDLVGVPYVVSEEAKRELVMVRKHELDEAEVIILDEVNRADLKTINAIFEFVQYGSINGEKLPKLHSVVATMNPNDGDYNGTSDLDVAFMDRFDIHLESAPSADLKYLRGIFGDAMATVLVEWYNNRKNDENNYISPRRLEKMGHAWNKIGSVNVLRDMMPLGITTPDYTSLAVSLTAVKRQERFLEKVKKEGGVDVTAWDKKFIRNNPDEVITVFKNTTGEVHEKVMDLIVDGLGVGVGVPKLSTTWLELFKEMTQDEILRMYAEFGYQKTNQFKRATNLR